MIRNTIVMVTIVFLVVVLAAALWLYSGIYPIGADEQHYRLTYAVLELLRERSIARAAQTIVPPQDLDQPERLLAGGADYNEMCAQCHLKPGKTQSDFSLGLYPAPPNLTLADDSSGHDKQVVRRRFWTIKHGIKASGMPAWKFGHNDERIWNMVAFLQRLPELSPEQYQIITTRFTKSHD
ncbi:cbb3-type cytochrome c oxidase subunit III [Alteromonadaceae bacterium 2753L.S.0a.02]|nr:cbb3-type cytochrome c oxidase subunit III [Alteromonadaceae bacterium 2753L.S.0a.02]